METPTPFEEKIPLYRRCGNSYDYVTQEEWTETPPDFIITITHERGSYNVCSTYGTLQRWLSDPANTFARWIKRPDVVSMDEVGRGGQPDPTVQYVKLFEGEFILKDEQVNSIIRGIVTNGRYIANQIGAERVGNLQGTFGIGQLHGQSPGYRVYKLERIIEPESAIEEYVDLSQLAMLPNEVLIEACERMDDLTLGRFTQTYKRAYEICYDVITRRRESFLAITNRQQLAERILSRLKNSYLFGKPNQPFHYGLGIYDGNKYTEIISITFRLNPFSTSQRYSLWITQWYNIPGAPWIFKEILSTEKSTEKPGKREGFVEGFRFTTIIGDKPSLKDILLQMLGILDRNGFILKDVDEFYEESEED